MSKEKGNDLTSLVRRCLQRDKRAWAALIERMSPIILSICRGMRLSRDETFEIFGQIQYLLLINLENVKSPDKLIGYVATMTKREIREANRRSNLLSHLHRTIVEEVYSSKNKTPDIIFEDTRQSEQLLGAVARLSPRCYRLLTALFLAESVPTYQELSKQLGIPVASIGPTRERCLKRLQKILEGK